MPDEPRTSVIMSAYRTNATVRDAVESALAQTVPDFELLVVDDGSEVPIADSLEGIRDPRLRLMRFDRNRGISAARNTALRVARAPLVSQLDSDDLWEPDYLENMLPVMDDPGVGLAYANVKIRNHPAGRTIGIEDPLDHPVYTFPRICNECPVTSPTPTMRTDELRRLGGWAEWLWSSADFYLYLELAVVGWRFEYVDKVLGTYTWPTAVSGTTFDTSRARRDDLKMWVVFMLRHPLTPGPRRQVRLRAPRELRRLVDRTG